MKFRVFGTQSDGATEHASRYEALRYQVLERRAVVARDGLAMLLRQGVAAWMEAWSALPTVPVRRAQEMDSRPSAWPEGTSVEVVHVLAAMALGHMEHAHL